MQRIDPSKNPCPLCKEGIATPAITCQDAQKPHSYHEKCLKTSYPFYQLLTTTSCPDPSCKKTIVNQASVQKKVEDFLYKRIFIHLRNLEPAEKTQIFIVFFNALTPLCLLFAKESAVANLELHQERCLKMALSMQLSFSINQDMFRIFLNTFITYCALSGVSKTTLTVGVLTIPFINLFGKVCYASLYPKKIA